MVTGCERSVLLVIAALSLFCIFGVCAEIPCIETSPKLGVVAVTDGETLRATFTCNATAVNVTVLQISWKLNGEILMNEKHGRVKITDLERNSFVTSELTLPYLTAEDNGIIIQCVAYCRTDMTKTFANISLSVLTLPLPLPPELIFLKLIIAILVLVFFSVLLVLIIILAVPVVIFKMRMKNVETIQDYASTAIAIGNPLQLPPQPPPHPPPHLPRQYPRQCPPRLPSHDNTIIISESSSINDRHSRTHLEDLEHHRRSQSVSTNTGKHKNKSETLPTSAQPSHPITRTDTPSQPSQPTTRTDTPSQPSQPTTRTNPPTQPSHNGNVDHLTADWIPTETSRNKTSSKDNVCKISNSNGEQSMVRTVYERIATCETVGNVYDKIGTYETITATRSAPHSTPRSDTPTQEETVSNDSTSEGASANEGGLNMATTAGVSHFQERSKHSPPVCVSGEVGSSEGAKLTDLATYETVGNVYDRICTYETIGNVYDNSLVPKLDFHETSM